MVVYAPAKQRSRKSNNHKEVSMCDTSNITVGTIVMVKVGRNEIEVVVTEITANGWKVKKVGSDREFIVTRIERVIAEPVQAVVSCFGSLSLFRQFPHRFGRRGARGVA